MVRVSRIPRRNKYNAVPTTVDGIRFASKREARRYGELKLLQKAGKITQLGTHPAYPLRVNGILIGKYTGDFTYEECIGRSMFVVTEDIKSPPTRKRADYKLRVKLFKALYPHIRFVEVE